MPSTRQSSLHSPLNKRPTRKAAGGVNYSDHSPKKAGSGCVDVKKNLGDAWVSWGKSNQTISSKTKDQSANISLGNESNFLIGNKKTTLVKKINPEILASTVSRDNVMKPLNRNQLPSSLKITKIESDSKPTKGPVRSVKVNEVWMSQPKQVLVTQNQSKPVIPQPLKPNLPEFQSVSLQKKLNSAAESNSPVRKIGKENWEVTNDIKNSASGPVEPVSQSIDTSPKSNSGHGTRPLRSTSTPSQKPNLASPLLSKSTGRVLKKPSIINSQKKSIVKTIKKLNQDQKKRIEERLGDIGSNLEKIKNEEELVKEPVPEAVVEKRPLKEILSDKSWLEMFLLTEPTARYSSTKDTLYCFTCRDMSEDNDGWVKGHSKGVEWLKYREHKLGEEHQKTSTKYFLQLFNAHYNS